MESERGGFYSDYKEVNPQELRKHLGEVSKGAALSCWSIGIRRPQPVFMFSLSRMYSISISVPV